MFVADGARERTVSTITTTKKSAFMKATTNFLNCAFREDKVSRSLKDKNHKK